MAVRAAILFVIVAALVLALVPEVLAIARFLEQSFSIPLGTGS